MQAALRKLAGRRLHLLRKIFFKTYVAGAKQ